MSNRPYQLVEQQVDQLEEKIKVHRMRILKLVLAVAVFLLIVAGCLYYIYENTTYTEYQVLERAERSDSDGSRFEAFGGNILKYSYDGVSCLDTGNRQIWSQTYEMQSPMVDICENYVAIADRDGKRIYIMDTEGPRGSVETRRPISQIQVANQGMIAVLMQENGTGYIELYDRDGNYLAEGELHTKKMGYPLSIAVSNDGRKMAVSMLDLNEGIVKSTVLFYNFGSVGQNEIDNIVSSYSYSDRVIPKVEFLTNDIAVAVGDTGMIFYEGNQKPVETQKIELEQEIRSLFYNGHYVGLVYENENSKDSYLIDLYNTKGTREQQIPFSMEYESISLLQNDEICILNNLECSIYNVRGKLRFHSNFEEDIYGLIHQSGHKYILLKEGATEKILLK
ncbi:MAG: hypothetical protein HFI41_15585 [Lachnospiraceae bacterium]|nr:hypothetical protein [Lachnospiraceae bacterium]